MKQKRINEKADILSKVLFLNKNISIVSTPASTLKMVKSNDDGGTGVKGEL